MSERSEYNFKEIEKSGQKYWDKEKSFKTEDFSKNQSTTFLTCFPIRQEMACMSGTLKAIQQLILSQDISVCVVFTYASHGLGRLCLPAEQYAIKTGITLKLLQKQILKILEGNKSLGFSTTGKERSTLQIQITTAGPSGFF